MLLLSLISPLLGSGFHVEDVKTLFKLFLDWPPMKAAALILTAHRAIWGFCPAQSSLVLPPLLEQQQQQQQK